MKWRIFSGWNIYAQRSYNVRPSHWYCQHSILPFLLFLRFESPQAVVKIGIQKISIPDLKWLQRCFVDLKLSMDHWIRRTKILSSTMYNTYPLSLRIRTHMKMWSFEFWFQIQRSIRDTNLAWILLCLDFKSHVQMLFVKREKKKKKNGTKLPNTAIAHSCGFSISIAPFTNIPAK